MNDSGLANYQLAKKNDYRKEIITVSKDLDEV